LNISYTEDVKTNSEGLDLLEAKLANKNMSAKDLSINVIFKNKSGMNIKITRPRLENSQEIDQNRADIDLNGLSVVALLTYGNFSILLTWNAGDIDILKVSNHGSRTGMSDSFINQVSPGFGLISVG